MTSPRTITIEPVTRVEGHAKITIHLDESGKVTDARLHVNEFRGFEKFCEGRLLWEMPGITSRICGICPASHLITSAKAGDAILAIGIPETAEKLRRLMTLGQWTQSHALSFFHLSSPDLLLGFDADPATRNLFGLMADHKDVVRRGIRLRKFGQEIIETLGGRRIHTPWAVPGGVREPLGAQDRDRLRGWIPEAKETAFVALELFERIHERFARDIPSYGNFESLCVGLVNEDGGLEYYSGKLRIRDGRGNTIADMLDPHDHHEYFGERSVDWSYLKFPYYKPLGPDDGVYRVGPLARLNVCDHIETPLAEAERRKLLALAGSSDVMNNPFYYHYARLIEIVFAIEKIEMLLDDAAILGTDIRSKAMINRNEGVGVCEAPRGLLFHRYHVDDDGVIQQVNMLIATAQNNLAMNHTIRQLASHHLDGGSLSEAALNQIEAGIRCYDPCLSCSTHAIGKMPLQVQLIGPSGDILCQRSR